MKHKTKTVSKRNPAKPAEAPKHYLSPVYAGTYSYKELAQRIAEESTLSVIDSAASLQALSKIIPDLLQKGIRVNLDGFGTFSLGISSTGCETPEEVSVNKIKKVRMRFAPATEVKSLLSTTQFEKVGSN